MNYTDYHLLRLEHHGLTPEEIEFNGLEFQLNQAKKNFKSTIRKTAELLKSYGVSATEIEELLNNKIKIKI
jgi:mevalonate kinase